MGIFSDPIIIGALTLAMLKDDSINYIRSARNWLKKVLKDLGSVVYDEYYGYRVPVFNVEESMTKSEEPTDRPVEWPELSKVTNINYE